MEITAEALCDRRSLGKQQREKTPDNPEADQPDTEDILIWE